jgi:hypothetical protein
MLALALMSDQGIIGERERYKIFSGGFGQFRWRIANPRTRSEECSNSLKK